tara:strand:+ start:948 stop:1631 length:684 start_codon:yes stop_codon:yes gene_type:complete
MHYGPKVVQELEICIDAFNSKSFSNATDIAGGNTTTLANTPTHSTDGYFTFDGVNEDLTITNNSYPSTFADDFSLEVWIYVPSGATWSNSYKSSIFTRGSYAGSHGIWRHPTDNLVSAFVRSGGTSKERTIAITRDAWHNLIMTWKNDTLLAIYKNGELGQSYDPSDITGLGTPEDTDWKICSQQAASGAQGTYFEGRMAMARMYKKALTAAEVKQNFDANRKRFGL